MLTIILIVVVVLLLTGGGFGVSSSQPAPVEPGKP
jgi:hypothetical protein